MTVIVAGNQQALQDVEAGLGSEERAQLADQLTKVLADTYVLMVKTHVYHWNVVGPLFVAVHKLTEEHYEDLFKAADEIAERVRALGALAPLSIGAMLPKASVEEEQRARRVEGMLAQLTYDHEQIARQIREAAELSDRLGDFATTDMLGKRLAFHEKAIWMLSAMNAST